MTHQRQSSRDVDEKKVHDPIQNSNNLPLGMDVLSLVCPRLDQRTQSRTLEWSRLITYRGRGLRRDVVRATRREEGRMM